MAGQSVPVMLVSASCRRRKTMTTLKPCPFCGSEPVFRKMEEDYTVLCNRCFVISDSYGSEKEAANKWNRRSNPWYDIASAPKNGSPVDLWINGYRVTNCQWDETKKEWTEGWLDNEGKYQSFAVMWAPPTYWMPIPEPPIAVNVLKGFAKRKQSSPGL